MDTLVRFSIYDMRSILRHIVISMATVFFLLLILRKKISDPYVKTWEINVFTNRILASAKMLYGFFIAPLTISDLR